MMSRNQIIETYLDLAAKAHEVEYYWENGIATDGELSESNNAALDYYDDNNITRQELTDYQDSKRNVVKTDNVNDALAAMKKAFS